MTEKEQWRTVGEGIMPREQTQDQIKEHRRLLGCVDLALFAEQQYEISMDNWLACAFLYHFFWRGMFIMLFPHPCYTTVLQILLIFQLAYEPQGTASGHNVDLLILNFESAPFGETFWGGCLGMSIFYMWVIMTNKEAVKDWIILSQFLTLLQ